MMYITPFPIMNASYLENTFPTHHWPLEHTRHAVGHKVGHAMHDFFRYESEMSKSPRTDIRETSKRFYIDVELPGLQSYNQVGLTWVNNKTLHLQGTIARPIILLDDDEKVSAKTASNGTGKKNEEEEENDDSVHFHDRERAVGKFARAFNFVVDVNHKTLTAKLANGVLRIVLEKVPHEQVELKDIKIEHTES